LLFESIEQPAPVLAAIRAAEASLATPFRARAGFARTRVLVPNGPPQLEVEAGRRGSSEDDLPLRVIALRTLATDGV
jgi:hypothetical protein